MFKGLFSRIGAGTVGTIVEAGIGAYSGYNPTEGVWGAVKGAAIGMFTGEVGIGVVKTLLGGGLGVGRARGIGGLALQAGKFILDRPITTAGVIGGTIGTGAFAVNIARGFGETTGAIQTLESPTLTGMRVNADYNKQGLMVSELGQIGGGMLETAPELYQRRQQEYENNWMDRIGQAGITMGSNTRTGRFINSTFGLTQGLHSGRHGGS